MTLLYDDTEVLLAIDDPQDATSVDDALDSLSGTVVTWLSLKAKADSYHLRVDRSLAAAANHGASIEQIAWSAGMSEAEVATRLRAVQPGLLSDAARARLGWLDVRQPEPDPRPGTPAAPVTAAEHESGSADRPAESARRGWFRRLGFDPRS